MSKVVVGLYDHFEDAKQAVQALKDAGFRQEDISLVANDAQGSGGQPHEQGDDVTDGAAKGAGIGAVVGGVGGLLLGLGALAIPGIGPVLAAGPLVAALAGAGIGAAGGGIIGALVDMGIPEDQARVYNEGVRRGGTLVAVQTSDDQADQAVNIMNRFTPVDINRRPQEWGVSGADRAEMPRQTEVRDADYSDMNTGQEGQKMDVVEEEMRVGKRQVDSGGVRVHSYITERPFEETVNLHQENVEVERHPVDRPASTRDLDTFQEETFEVSATSEEPVVEKRARVVEEVEVNKNAEDRPETIRDTIRRKDVEVEDLNASRTGESSDFDVYDPMFRQDYQTTYSQMGDTYENFRPAYRYGFDLANDPRYQGQDWNMIEADARRNWEMQHRDTPWERVQDAVHTAWERVSGNL